MVKCAVVLGCAVVKYVQFSAVHKSESYIQHSTEHGIVVAFSFSSQLKMFTTGESSPARQMFSNRESSPKRQRLRREQGAAWSGSPTNPVGESDKVHKVQPGSDMGREWERI